MDLTTIVINVLAGLAALQIVIKSVCAAIPGDADDRALAPVVKFLETVGGFLSVKPKA